MFDIDTTNENSMRILASAKNAWMRKKEKIQFKIKRHEQDWQIKRTYFFKKLDDGKWIFPLQKYLVRFKGIRKHYGKVLVSETGWRLYIPKEDMHKHYNDPEILNGDILETKALINRFID